MKNKYWIMLVTGFFLICIFISLFLFHRQGKADSVQIWSDGVLVETVSLLEDRTLLVQGDNGINTVTVKNGAVAVTEADCPDHYCMKRGFCSGGPQIVCLPNRLLIQFVAEGEIDAVVG